jgi:protein SHQ1
MITPTFVVSQTADFVIIELKCPFIKAQNVQIDVDHKQLRFYANPYFIKLNWTHPLVQDGTEKSSYDIDTGIVRLQYPCI